MVSRRVSKGLTSLACFVVAQGALFAQVGQTTGTVRGIVSEKKGAFVEDATVTLHSLETGATRSVKTDILGYYSFALLPVGSYEITISAKGLKTVNDKHIKVTLGQATTLNFDMDTAEATATVEVVDVAGAVDTKQVNVMASVDEKAIEAVPLVTRNFQDLARLTPGVVAGAGSPARLISQGARQIFNGILIDGANTNSGFFGEQRGAAYQPFTFGLDTIRELQVVTNGYDPQYGSAGATINAITKGGTNEFAGTGMVEFRRSSWTATSKPVPYDPTGSINVAKNLVRTNDSKNIGVTFGGPILKDKLFFFIGAEQYKKDVTAQPVYGGFGTAGSGNTAADFTALAASPLAGVVLSTRGLTVLQEFGNPVAGTLPAAYPLYTDNKVFFGRLDYNLNENHRFVLRGNYTQLKDVLLQTSNSPNNAESFLLTTPGLSSVSWVVEANDIWTADLFTESHLQIANERRPFRGNSVGAPALQLPNAPTGAGRLAMGTKTSAPRESNEVATQFISTTTWVHGDWTLKGGVDLLKSDVDNQFFNNGGGSLNISTFALANAWARGIIDNTVPGTILYSGATSISAGRIQMWNKVYQVFAGAQYQGLLSKRLNLSGGLRYVTQSFSDNPLPNPNLGGLDKGFGANAVDPRISFSLDLDGKGKSVLRGGYGWFSSPTPMLLHSNTMTGNGQLITNYSFGLPAAGSRNANLLNVFNGVGAANIGANGLISGTTLSRVSDSMLAALAGTGFFGASGSSTSVWDPDTHLSRAKKSSLTFERDMGDGLVVGLTGVYTLYENLQYFQDINLNQVGGHAYTDGYQPGINTWSTAGRPNTATVRGHVLDFRPGAQAPGNPTGGFTGVYLVKTDGYGRYRGLTFTVNKKWSEETGLQANLTFSKAEDTSSFERGTYSSGNLGDPYSELGASLAPNPADIGSSFGTSNNDRFMVLNLVTYHPLPWGIHASWRFLYQTGLPYSAFTQKDLNGDGMLNELASGSRNSLRQDDEKQLDLRLNRVFKLHGRFEIEAILDVYNVFNWQTPFVDANIGQGLPAQSGASTFATDATGTQILRFGKQTIPAQNTRELQVGVRLKF